MSSVKYRCQECGEVIDGWETERLKFVSIGQAAVDNYCTNCLSSGDIPGIIKIPEQHIYNGRINRLGTVKKRLFRQTVTT